MSFLVKYNKYNAFNELYPFASEYIEAKDIMEAKKIAVDHARELGKSVRIGTIQPSRGETQ